MPAITGRPGKMRPPPAAHFAHNLPNAAFFLAEFPLLLFLVFIVLITGLQLFHRRLLHKILPPGYDRWVTPGLLLVHVPLAIHLLLRLTGHSGSAPWLLPFAHLGLYFQMFTVLALIAEGLSVAAWRLSHLYRQGPGTPPENPSRRKFLRKTTAAGAGLAAYGAVHGARLAQSDPEITRLQLPFPDLPAGLDGLRMVQISDLHVGPMVSLELASRWRRAAEAERPELLLITGDLVDSRPEEIKDFVTAFQGFKPPLGTFAILGNHDYFTDPRPIWAAMEAMGITMLENRSALVDRKGSQLALVGIQDPMARHGHFRDIRYGPGPDPAAAVQGLPDGAWRLCLSHRPSDWHLARKTKALLTLSGHTHGGQVNLIPGLSSALLLGPYAAGLYRHQQQLLYVNRGLGVVGLPVRFGAPPEITVITLRRG